MEQSGIVDLSVRAIRKARVLIIGVLIYFGVQSALSRAASAAGAGTMKKEKPAPERRANSEPKKLIDWLSPERLRRMGIDPDGDPIAIMWEVYQRGQELKAERLASDPTQDV